MRHGTGVWNFEEAINVTCTKSNNMSTARPRAESEGICFNDRLRTIEYNVCDDQRSISTMQHK